MATRTTYEPRTSFSTNAVEDFQQFQTSLETLERGLKNKEITVLAQKILIDTVAALSENLKNLENSVVCHIADLSSLHTENDFGDLLKGISSLEERIGILHTDLLLAECHQEPAPSWTLEQHSPSARAEPLHMSRARTPDVCEDNGLHQIQIRATDLLNELQKIDDEIESGQIAPLPLEVIQSYEAILKEMCKTPHVDRIFTICDQIFSILHRIEWRGKEPFETAAQQRELDHLEGGASSAPCARDGHSLQELHNTLKGIDPKTIEPDLVVHFLKIYQSLFPRLPQEAQIFEETGILLANIQSMQELHTKEALSRQFRALEEAITPGNSPINTAVLQPAGEAFSTEIKTLLTRLAGEIRRSGTKDCIDKLCEIEKLRPGISKRVYELFQTQHFSAELAVKYSDAKDLFYKEDPLYRRHWAAVILQACEEQK